MAVAAMVTAVVVAAIVVAPIVVATPRIAAFGKGVVAEREGGEGTAGHREAERGEGHPTDAEDRSRSVAD
jgi:hypothetical protein